jgi:bacteriorhodopsin
MSQLLGAVWLGFGIAFAAFPHQILQLFSRYRPTTEQSVSRVRTFGMFVIATVVLWMFFR